MKVVGILITMSAGFFVADWSYRALKRGHTSDLIAATVSGLGITVVASVGFLLLKVHQWWFGPETSWGFSVFLGFCVGLCQAVLFRGGLLEPRGTGDDERGAQHAPEADGARPRS